MTIAQQKTPELLNDKLIKLSDRAKAAERPEARPPAEMNLPVKTSDLVGRDAQVPEIGALSGAASVVFTLPKGGISGPMNEGANGAVLQVLEKQEPSADDIAKNFDATKSKAAGPAAPGGVQRLCRIADGPLREGRRDRVQQEAGGPRRWATSAARCFAWVSHGALAEWEVVRDDV